MPLIVAAKPSRYCGASSIPLYAVATCYTRSQVLKQLSEEKELDITAAVADISSPTLLAEAAVSSALPPVASSEEVKENGGEESGEVEDLISPEAEGALLITGLVPSVLIGVFSERAITIASEQPV